MEKIAPQSKYTAEDVKAYEHDAAHVLANFDAASSAIHRLASSSRSCDDQSSDPSLALLRGLRKQLTILVVRPEPPASPINTTVSTWSGRVGEALLRLHRWIAPYRVQNSRVLWTWTWLSLGLAAAVGYAATHNRFGISLAALSLRVVGSLFAGTVRFDKRSQNPVIVENARSCVERCVASHLGDVISLLGVSWALVLANRAVWAVAVAGAAVLTNTGTLMRVAAVHVGVIVHRKGAERVARRGSMFIGLICAAFVQRGIPTTGVPLLAVAAVGPTLYALIEMYVTHQRLGVANDGERTVTMEIDDANGYSPVSVWMPEYEHLADRSLIGC